MTATQDILRVGVAAQAASLLAQDVKLMKKKKIKSKDILRSGITKLVGIPILRTQSQLIGSIA